jgi:hypothetical protein
MRAGFRQFQALALLGGLLLTPATPAVANLRAAIYRDMGASGALRPVPGLLLEHERLAFTFEGVYGDLQDQARNPSRNGQIEAVYRFRSETGRPGEFAFITPSAGNARAWINGRELPVQVSPFTEPLPARTDRRGEAPAARFSLAFAGDLRAGVNEVTVTYSQPLSVQETGLRYFHRSRWHTFAEYEFWPIQEWTRTPDFRAEITLSIPRRRGLGEWLFGPSLRPSALGIRRQRDSQPLDLPYRLEKTRDRLLAHFTLTGEMLPDLLLVAAREKE